MSALPVPLSFWLPDGGILGETTLVEANPQVIVLETTLAEPELELTSTYAAQPGTPTQSIHLLVRVGEDARCTTGWHGDDVFGDVELPRSCLLDHLWRVQSSALDAGYVVAIDVGDEACDLVDVAALR